MTPEGTRFLIYPQYDEGFEPEVVVVSAPAGSIGPGPSDWRMYVADAVVKDKPYDPPGLGPPYRGPVYPPAMGDIRGHFDTIPTDAPQFRAAHLFGMVRHTLDIWERATGERVHWWHPDAPARLELIPIVRWRNAQSGPGFLETGIWQAADGVGDQLFCFNHDVVAHETGHSILFGWMGVPDQRELTRWFFGLHESFADLNAVVCALHFPSVRRRLLAETGGNLYALNIINRLGKVAPHQQMRLACNETTMADVAGITMDTQGNWHDALGLDRNCHALADPLTGAVFDCFVEIYQHFLVTRGLVRPEHDPRGRSQGQVRATFGRVRQAHEAGLANFAAEFDAAVADARDAVHGCLIAVARTLSPARMTFDRVAARMLESCLAQGLSPLLERLAGHFTRRGMDPLSHMTFRPAAEHRNARRMNRRLVPAIPVHRQDPRCACRWHFGGSRRFMPHGHRGEAG